MCGASGYVRVFSLSSPSCSQTTVPKQPQTHTATTTEGMTNMFISASTTTTVTELDMLDHKWRRLKYDTGKGAGATTSGTTPGLLSAAVVHASGVRRGYYGRRCGVVCAFVGILNGPSQT